MHFNFAVTESWITESRNDGITATFSKWGFNKKYGIKCSNFSDIYRTQSNNVPHLTFSMLDA